MLQGKGFYLKLYYITRTFASKSKPMVIPEETVFNEIKKNKYKVRNHPGILNSRTVSLPDSLVKTIFNVIEDYPFKALCEDAKALNRHLISKQSPIEKNNLKKVKLEAQARVLSRYNTTAVTSGLDRQKLLQSVDIKVDRLMKEEVYNWKAVNYDTYNSLVYLVGRIAPEYAVLIKIFMEIAKRNPEFTPKSLIDFGSGVGSVSWAINNVWNNSIVEYFNVDASSHMNNLAQTLLLGEKCTSMHSLKGIYFRQFLPASKTTYDLVVSAYSLLELPSQESRLEIVINLWNKTRHYLVIVEHGTNAGFKTVNEARDLILQLDHKYEGHVFSPCPHDISCPRFVRNDGTPCNFCVHFQSLAVGAVSKSMNEKYSYVVLKKGQRDDAKPQWPRMVRETLVRSKHTICRMCTKDAQLEEIVFTRSKHGKQLYHCARSTKWGDLLPVRIKT